LTRAAEQGGVAAGETASEPMTVGPVEAGPRSSTSPSPAITVISARGGADLDLETRVAGRWLNRIGILAVIVGVAFFLKYAIDNAWVGPAGQVSLGVLLGTALVWWSARLHHGGYAYFADGLTGLGGAVLYLSLWAAGNYYALLPSAAAFLAMAAVTASLVVVAIGRGSERVALLVLLGGLATPALLSTGADRQVELFLYLALLNAAVLPVARRRDWRWLALPALAGTELYFWTWFAEFYEDGRWLSTTLFAVLFFAEFFVLPALAGARRRLRPEQVSLLFANSALLLVALRAVMWPEREVLLTAATLLLAAAHLAAARAIPSAGPDRVEGPPARVLYAGLALALATLAVFIGLDGPWIAVAWAIEGGTLVWSGVRTGERRLRLSGLALFALVAWRLAAAPLSADRFLFNPRFAVFLAVIASAALAVAWVYRAGPAVKAPERGWFWALGIGANVLAIVAMTLEIYEFFEPPAGAPFTRDAYLAAGLTTSLAWTAYAAGFLYFGARQRLAGLRWVGLAFMGLTTAKVFFLDFAALSGIYRIVSSLALGVVLLIVSFVYQRRLTAAREEVL
jgi:uncharacterized membrane protein